MSRRDPILREWTVGIDFGGTNVKIGLVNRRGRVAHTAVLTTRRIGTPKVFIPAVSRAIEQLSLAVGIRTSGLRGVGVGAPGLIDVRRGMVHHLVNVRGWRHVPLARMLRQRLRCPCAVDNDVNLVTLGEWSFGAGRGAQDLVCLTLGTGVGGGLVIGNQLYRGASGSAGEIGHMVIRPGGQRCACGSRGCFETEVGTAAIVRGARLAMRRGARILCQLSRRSRGGMTPELVCRAAKAGDRAAREVWVRCGHWLGVGIANVANLLNPERIIIGGGVAKAWPLLLPSLKKTFRAHAMDVPARTARIVRGQLGDEAGIVGAAVLVWRETAA